MATTFRDIIRRVIGPAAPRPVGPQTATEGAAPLRTAAPVHVLADDALLRLGDGRLVIRHGDGSEEQVLLDELAQVSLHGDGGITSPCLRALMGRGVPVVFRARSGHYAGQTVDLSGVATATRRAQYAAAADPVQQLAVARPLVRAKIINARGVLRRRV